MLTDSEKRWLHSREPAPMAYCVWCYKFDLCGMTCKAGWCPTDYTPADDFDARVAAKLAKLDCVLKYARLAVEEEMDGIPV